MKIVLILFIGGVWNMLYNMLWSYIATANGLKEWFADDAKMDGKEVVLIWNGVEQGLSIVGLRTEKYIRYRWSEDTDKTYFELRIMTSELTGNSVLCVTDFAEPEELQEAKDLWHSVVVLSDVNTATSGGLLNRALYV